MFQSFLPLLRQKPPAAGGNPALQDSFYGIENRFAGTPGKKE